MSDILSRLLVIIAVFSSFGSSRCMAASPAPRTLPTDRILMDVKCGVDGLAYAQASFPLNVNSDYPGVYTNVGDSSNVLIGDIKVFVTGGVRLSGRNFSLCLAAFQAVRATDDPPAVLWTVAGQFNQLLRDFRTGDQPQACLPIPKGASVRVDGYATEASGHGAYCDFSFRLR